MNEPQSAEKNWAFIQHMAKRVAAAEKQGSKKVEITPEELRKLLFIAAAADRRFL